MARQVISRLARKTLIPSPDQSPNWSQVLASLSQVDLIGWKFLAVVTTLAVAKEAVIVLTLGENAGKARIELTAQFALTRLIHPTVTVFVVYPIHRGAG